MADMTVPCPVCHGNRYNEATLSVKFRNHSIADILHMSVDQACLTFESFDRLYSKLDCLRKVGLGYMSLGQSSSTLSGGEAQRIKLSLALAGRNHGESQGQTLYFLDEPTNGLHIDDVQLIINVLLGVVDQGNTVVVIEHNLDLVRAADWLIDLGPGGGDEGGHIIFQGTHSDILKCAKSETGKVLNSD